jgi:inorganic triphosphatase YgiF
VREVELKFELSERDARKLARARIFGKAHRTVTPMHAIYFDTANRALLNHGMALRLRDEGGRWVQCVKAGHSGAAGLHARDEWEWQRPRPTLDLAKLRGTPLAALLARNRKLSPVFEVRMERIAWQVQLDEGSVEVALDRGDVRSGRKRSPVCEVEIELLDGDASAVFAMAERVLDVVALRASSVTKAQRGYGLAHTRRPAAAKALPVQIDAATPIDVAARRIVGASLAQMQGNEALAAAPRADDEFLHQFRVGLRRLRSALRVFHAEFPRSMHRRMRDDCRWLSRATSEARNWDVFIGQTLPAVLSAAPAPARKGLRSRAAQLREESHARVRQALDSPRYTRFVLDFARWMAGARSDSKESLLQSAERAVRRQHRKALRNLRRVAALDPDARHQLRIRLKRLRYASEAVAPVFGRDRKDPYIDALARLQDDLGGAADARVGMRLARKLRIAAAVRRAVDSALAAAEAASLREVGAHAAALRDAPRFWQAKER